MGWQEGEAHSRLLMPKLDLHFDVSRAWTLSGSVAYTSWESEVSTEQNDLLQPTLFATWTAWGGRNRFSFGGDSRHMWFQRTGLDSVRSQWAYGLFVQDSLTLGAHWSLSASTRLDHVEALDPVVSPKLALLYRPIDAIGLRLSLSRGFRAPTVQDRYEQAYGHGGTALRFGNPDLQPETSTSLAFSLEAAPHPTLDLFAGGSLSLVDDFIALRYTGPWDEDPTKDKWERANILRAWIYGAEARARWAPLAWLRLTAGYAYGGNHDESADKQLQFLPGHTITGKLDLSGDVAPHWRLGGFVRALYRVGRSAWSWKPAQGAARDDEDGYVTELANFVGLDAGAEVRFHAWTAFVTMTNLLSQDIEHLDDALTCLDGTPLWRVGLRADW